MSPNSTLSSHLSQCSRTSGDRSTCPGRKNPRLPKAGPEIIAVVLVVASVGVTIHLQVRSETEREYRVELFRQKLELHKDTIACVTRADDDGVIDDHEIEEMRNYARLTALVGNRELVSALAEFVSAVEESGSITREEDRGSSSRFPSTSSHVDSSLDEPPQFDEVRRLDGIISPQQILHYFGLCSPETMFPCMSSTRNRLELRTSASSFFPLIMSIHLPCPNRSRSVAEVSSTMPVIVRKVSKKALSMLSSDSLSSKIPR